MGYMRDRRAEPRMLCADLVTVEWRDDTGRRKRTIANLEDISHSGACLQLDLAIPPQTRVRITYPDGVLSGAVRYCVYREIGYFVGVEFEEGSNWSRRSFKPMHLLDPRKLIVSDSDTDEEEPAG